MTLRASVFLHTDLTHNAALLTARAEQHLAVQTNLTRARKTHRMQRGDGPLACESPSRVALQDLKLAGRRIEPMRQCVSGLPCERSGSQGQAISS